MRSAVRLCKVYGKAFDRLVGDHRLAAVPGTDHRESQVRTHAFSSLSL